jgi:hypothetical protein
MDGHVLYSVTLLFTPYPSPDETNWNSLSNWPKVFPLNYNLRLTTYSSGISLAGASKILNQEV